MNCLRQTDGQTNECTKKHNLLVEVIIVYRNRNKGDVVSFHPTTESNLRTALGVEICKLCIIARIWKPFSDFCSEMGICSDVM